MKANQCTSKYYLKSAGFLLWKNKERNKHLLTSIFGITPGTWEKMRKYNKKPWQNKQEDPYCDLNNFIFPKAYCTNKFKKG